MPQVLDRLHDGVAVFGADGGLVHANEACRNLFKPIAREFKPGATFGALMSLAGDKNILADAFVGPGELEFSEGRVILLRESALPGAGVVRTFSDLTEYRRQQAQIVYEASLDEVTGLPNRSLFLDRLGAALRQSARAKKQLAVLFIDLDGFKALNDTLGHEAGDLVLKQVGVRLSARVRASDTVARFGGDEFVVLLLEISNADDVGMVAKSIVDELSRPFLVRGDTAVIGASIGVAVYPRDGGDGDELIRRADNAMYDVKHSGKRGYRHASELTS
ncbi:MAG: diguanylate cyclase [Rhodospirillaceae bacterium]